MLQWGLQLGPVLPEEVAKPPCFKFVFCHLNSRKNDFLSPPCCVVLSV